MATDIAYFATINKDSDCNMTLITKRANTKAPPYCLNVDESILPWGGKWKVYEGDFAVFGTKYKDIFALRIKTIKLP